MSKAEVPAVLYADEDLDLTERSLRNWTRRKKRRSKHEKRDQCTGMKLRELAEILGAELSGAAT